MTPPHRFLWFRSVHLTVSQKCASFERLSFSHPLGGSRMLLHGRVPDPRKHAAQLLVQALVISRLDYCNALLAGLPSNTIKPLQIIQNVAARLVFNEPKRAHVTPLFISLHWQPFAAHIKFKTLMLAYRTTTGSAPFYFHSL